MYSVRSTDTSALLVSPVLLVAGGPYCGKGRCCPWGLVRSVPPRNQGLDTGRPVEQRVLRRNMPVLGIHWCGKQKSLRFFWGLSGFLNFGSFCPFCEVRVQGCFLDSVHLALVHVAQVLSGGFLYFTVNIPTDCRQPIPSGANHGCQTAALRKAIDLQEAQTEMEWA